MTDTDSSLERSLSSSPISGEDPEVVEAICDAWCSACDQWGEQWGEQQARRKFARVFHEPAPVDAEPKKPNEPVLNKASVGVVVGMVVDVEPPAAGLDCVWWHAVIWSRAYIYYILYLYIYIYI